MVYRIAASFMVVLSCGMYLAINEVHALSSHEEWAAVIAFPEIVLHGGSARSSGKIAAIAFGSRVVLVPAGRGRRPVPVAMGGMRRVRWSGREGWVEYASLLPGARLSLDEVSKEDLEPCGPCFEKFFKKAAVSLKRIDRGDLRPSAVPYPLNSLVLTRREGVLSPAGFVGSEERLEIKNGVVRYTHCLGGGASAGCIKENDDGPRKVSECGNLVVQMGSCERGGTHLLVKLAPGHRKELFCR